MARSIRTNYYLKQHNLDSSKDYEKQIYVKNTSWHPPPAPLHIEDKISSFEKILKEQHKTLLSKNKKRSLLNLTPLQKSVLQQLRCNDKIVIKPTDKNLGPAVMDKNDYIQQVLKEHLLTKDYQQLSQNEALHKLNSLKDSLKNIITTHSGSLTDSEKTYFQRSLKTKLRLPIFYGLPKVHKSPLSLRPVVSSSSGLLTIFSTWLDFRMKELLPLIRSYTKNSFEIIKDLKQLNLPSNALLFSADAKSMYTNIDSNTGLLTFQNFFETNAANIPPNFPVTLFLNILEMIMKNNIFSFSDTFWLQLSGTAMGTPAACAYATITYGHFENTEILTEFHLQIPFYRRYIDDILGPPSCLKGLISGELRRYWLQNNQGDFVNILTKFIQRLTDRGHKLTDLIPLFRRAAIKLNATDTGSRSDNNEDTLFIHWTFHPNGLQRKDIREAYKTTLQVHLEYTRMTVAIARPHNLRDILSKTTLTVSPEFSAKSCIDKLSA